VEWKSAKRNDQGLTEIPRRWLHVHYYEALNILFRFENSVRVFVYAVLKNEFHENWLDCSFSIGGSDPQSIKGIAAKRISQAENFGYLGFDIRSPLMHLTSSELIELLTSEAYWPKFRRYFRGTKEIIKNKLLEIGAIRNALAHFRPIKQDDIELIKQNSRHALIEVERCLEGVFHQALRVPTNLTDEWYKRISTLGTEHVSIVPFYSSDEAWIDIQMTIKSNLLNKRNYGESYFNYTVTKINSSNILNDFPALRKHATYLNERVSYPMLSKEIDIRVSKELNFVFHKNRLTNSYEEIVQDFSAALRVITEEMELVGQDNLARGRIVETAQVTAFYRQKSDKAEGRWEFGATSLETPYKSDDPPEYWGQRIYSSDFVAGLQRYPWMPEDISEDDTFF
jgi:hypothetical protein